MPKHPKKYKFSNVVSGFAKVYDKSTDAFIGEVDQDFDDKKWTASTPDGDALEIRYTTRDSAASALWTDFRFKPKGRV